MQRAKVLFAMITAATLLGLFSMFAATSRSAVSPRPLLQQKKQSFPESTPPPPSTGSSSTVRATSPLAPSPISFSRLLPSTTSPPAPLANRVPNALPPVTESDAKSPLVPSLKAKASASDRLPPLPPSTPSPRQAPAPLPTKSASSAPSQPSSSPPRFSPPLSPECPKSKKRRAGSTIEVSVYGDVKSYGEKPLADVPANAQRGACSYFRLNVSTQSRERDVVVLAMGNGAGREPLFKAYLTKYAEAGRCELVGLYMGEKAEWVQRTDGPQDFRIAYLPDADIRYFPSCTFLPEFVRRLRHGLVDRSQAFARRKSVAAFISNCNARFRSRWVAAFNKAMHVDHYGTCFHNAKGGNDRNKPKWSERKEETLQQYQFALAVENANASGYVTEKVFNALRAGAIPIYWGTDDVYNVVPRGSIINIAHYDSAEAVAAHVRRVQANRTLFDSYHRWGLAEVEAICQDKCGTPVTNRLCDYLHNRFDNGTG